LLGREFRQAIEALDVPQEQIQKLNAVSSDLNRFWQKHREFLGTIRNALVAHREHDSLRYAETLEILKPLEVMVRAAELSALLERLVQALTEVASLTSHPTVILRDIITSGNKGQVN
jgi:hypothetical protein